MRRLIVIALLISSTASAHEIGTTKVNIRFPDHATWTAEIVADPQTLLNKVEVAERMVPSGAMPLPEAQRRLESMTPALLKRIDLRFDGQRVQPRRVEVESSVLRLTGDTPPSARTLTWQYGWSYASYALTVGTATQWLEGDQSSEPIAFLRPPPPLTRAQVFKQYVALGFTHIVPHGVDHILFIVGLFLLATSMRALLLQITAFTIAHSLTLALTMLDLVSLSPRIVEPLIAVSIVYIAVENIATSKLHSWRVAVVFLFGLLHGMGFAGVLRELALPRSEFLTGLVAFNLGVELGQLTVVALAFAAVGAWRGRATWYRQRIVVPASLVIAAIGLFWAVQRTIA